jgi:hypothetical protein
MKCRLTNSFPFKAQWSSAQNKHLSPLSLRYLGQKKEIRKKRKEQKLKTKIKYAVTSKSSLNVINFLNE